MLQGQRGASEVRLERARARVEEWRRTRVKLSPMPAALWEEATALARELGVFPVKRALGLNYASLKERAGLEMAASGPFLELSGAQWGAEPASGGSVVELTERDGTRLTVRLGPGQPLELPQLLEAFRRRS